MGGCKSKEVKLLEDSKAVIIKDEVKIDILEQRRMIEQFNLRKIREMREEEERMIEYHRKQSLILSVNLDNKEGLWGKEILYSMRWEGRFFTRLCCSVCAGRGVTFPSRIGGIFYLGEFVLGDYSFLNDFGIYSSGVQNIVKDYCNGNSYLCYKGEKLMVFDSNGKDCSGDCSMNFHQFSWNPRCRTLIEFLLRPNENNLFVLFCSGVCMMNRRKDPAYYAYRMEAYEFRFSMVCDSINQGKKFADLDSMDDNGWNLCNQ